MNEARRIDRPPLTHARLGELRSTAVQYGKASTRVMIDANDLVDLCDMASPAVFARDNRTTSPASGVLSNAELAALQRDVSAFSRLAQDPSLFAVRETVYHLRLAIEELVQRREPKPVLLDWKEPGSWPAGGEEGGPGL